MRDHSVRVNKSSRYINLNQCWPDSSYSYSEKYPPTYNQKAQYPLGTKIQIIRTHTGTINNIITLECINIKEIDYVARFSYWNPAQVDFLKTKWNTLPVRIFYFSKLLITFENFGIYEIDKPDFICKINQYFFLINRYHNILQLLRCPRGQYCMSNSLNMCNKVQYTY